MGFSNLCILGIQSTPHLLDLSLRLFCSQPPLKQFVVKTQPLLFLYGEALLQF
jgi:hypothetical protein